MEESDLEDERSEEVEAEEEAGGLTVCSHCGKGYQDIRSHIYQVHLSVNTCLICDQELSDADGLQKHLRHLHPHLIGLMPPTPDQLKAIVAVKVDKLYLERAIEKFKIQFKGMRKLKLDEYYSWWDDDMFRGKASVQVITPETLKQKFKPPKNEEQKVLPDDDITEPERSSDVKKSPDHDYTHLAVACYYLSSEEARKGTFKRRNFIYTLKVVNNRGLKTVELHIRRVGLNQPWTIVITIAIYDDNSRKVPADGFEQWTPSYIAKVLLLANGESQYFLIPNIEPEDDKLHSFLHYRSTKEEILSKDPSLKLPFSLPMSWEGKGKFRCRHCRTFFDELLRRRVHEIIHTTGECPFKGCEEKYEEPNEEDFISHVLEHQPLFCDEPDCDKVFFAKRNLNGHAAVHRNTRFFCDECDRSYKQERTLKQHVKEEHRDDGTVFDCDECGLNFDRRRKLTQHKRKVHSKASNAQGEIDMNLFVPHSKLQEKVVELLAIIESQNLELEQARQELARVKEELQREKQKRAKPRRRSSSEDESFPGKKPAKKLRKN